ncbi:MAG: hypothetical protein ACK53G_09200 [Armatimonadota bacterium]
MVDLNADLGEGFVTDYDMLCNRLRYAPMANVSQHLYWSPCWEPRIDL